MVALSVGLFALSLALGCFRPSEKLPPKRSLEELQDACERKVHPERGSTLRESDRQACWEVAPLLIERGEVDAAVDAYNRACTRIPQACVTLALMYQFGDGVEQDSARAGGLLGRAGVNGDARGWADLRMLRRPRDSMESRNRVEKIMYNSCDLGDAGWPCYNYGVALACGYFGPPDLKYAHYAFFRGCDLGDSRSCTLSADFQVNPRVLSCDLIGPHPKFNRTFEVNVEPADPDAPPPEGPRVFHRRPFSWR